MASKKAPLNVRVDLNQTCLQWLATNGYADVVKLINGLTRKWTEEYRATRRDWWVVLAGTASGEPRSVDGVFFPVLKAARRRQGFPPDVAAAIENSPHELAPSIKKQARWGQGAFKRSMR